MFELTVLGINVVLPAVVTLVALVGALLLNRAPATRQVPTGQPVSADQLVNERTRIMEFALGALVAAASSLAIWLAVALRNQWSVWHEDAWMRMPTGVALVALAAGVTSGLKLSWLVWLIRAASVLLAAHFVFPVGEAWAFLLPVKEVWLASMVASTLVGWFLIERRQSRQAAELGLGWILLLIAAAYLTSQSFLRITEPLMAVASVLGCLGLANLWSRTPPLIGTAAGPCLFALSAAVASAQFNSFIGLPDALSWFAMSTPAMAALLTQWTNKRKLVWPTLLVCLVLAVAVIGWVFFVTPSGGEDW